MRQMKEKKPKSSGFCPLSSSFTVIVMSSLEGALVRFFGILSLLFEPMNLFPLSLLRLLLCVLRVRLNLNENCIWLNSIPFSYSVHMSVNILPNPSRFFLVPSDSCTFSADQIQSNHDALTQLLGPILWSFALNWFRNSFQYSVYRGGGLASLRIPCESPKWRLWDTSLSTEILSGDSFRIVRDCFGSGIVAGVGWTLGEEEKEEEVEEGARHRITLVRIRCIPRWPLTQAKINLGRFDTVSSGRSLRDRWARLFSFSFSFFVFSSPFLLHPLLFFCFVYVFRIWLCSLFISPLLRCRCRYSPLVEFGSNRESISLSCLFSGRDGVANSRSLTAHYHLSLSLCLSASISFSLSLSLSCSFRTDAAYWRNQIRTWLKVVTWPKCGML